MLVCIGSASGENIDSKCEWPLYKQDKENVMAENTGMLRVDFWEFQKILMTDSCKSQKKEETLFFSRTNLIMPSILL